VVVSAKAPGKLVVLGEYAVLTGAPALVLAIDRCCHAEIQRSHDEHCHLSISAPLPEERSFELGAASGMELIDIVIAADSAAAPAWSARVDTSSLFDGEKKLGIGSSAAALTAWAAAWSSFCGDGSIRRDTVSLEVLIGLHRAFQGGSGSGLDIAASLFGGAITFERIPGSTPRIGTVRLPNSVGFTSVFTGCSASTRDFVAVFNDWMAARPREAREQLQILTQLAEDGCAAVDENDADAFLAAVAAYGVCLEVLGDSIGVAIVTDEHRELAGHAEKFGVIYKVSGAGGGDLGVAFSVDDDALAAFKNAAQEKYKVVDFRLDESGLSVEELED
jgi:phosphomevalonate kinase